MVNKPTPHARQMASQPDLAPESATGFVTKPLVHTRKAMVVTANPLATEAGLAILHQGGSAVDAAIAAQMLLGLTEPQSSGIGGGALLVFYDGTRVVTLDGRETAPATATPERFLQQSGEPLAFYDAVIGGRSVGVPGVLSMLAMAHRRYGRLPWHVLFEPAIHTAEAGFPISPRLHQMLAHDRYLKQQEPARSYFYRADGSPRAIGALLRNAAYGQVLRHIAKYGANAFYYGELVVDMVKAVQQHPSNPGDLSAADFAAYAAKQRQPVRATYRGHVVYGMPPPSAGGLAMLQMLGILEHGNVAARPPLDIDSVHLFAEAGRLAYADRNRYAADSDVVEVPVAGLLDRHYLADRYQRIHPTTCMGVALPGEPWPGLSATLGDAQAGEFPSTSHISIVDAQGRAVSLTTSIESAFGSRIMVNGYLLNNQLTDFSFVPVEQGKAVANRVAGGKRPRSAMTPTLVFDATGQLTLVVGSPGGSAIINYVARTLIAMLDWHLDPQQATHLPHYGSRNGPTELEAGHGLESLVPGLQARGHEVRLSELNSGLSVIQRTATGYAGSADPRREGTAQGY